MNINPVASYYSATADIGRKPVRLATGSHKPASHYSATADIGRDTRKTQREIFVESSQVNGTGGVGGRNGALALYSRQQALADNRSAGPASTISFKLANEGRSLDNQSNFFTRLQDSLLNLSARLLDLQPIESFNPNTTLSSNENAVRAASSTLAKEGEYEITVESLARSHEIASDEVTDILSDSDATAYDKLSLAGSFTINGYTITITSTDSLADIRDAINVGEDQDGDGELNTQSEDLNENGKLDVYYTPSVYIGGDRQYLAAFSYSEDRNKDGLLDSSEDTNDNDTLDGGSAQIKAEARIEDNRLIITSLEDGSAELRIKDDENILETLGFYKRDDLDTKVMKTSVDNSYNKDQQEAKYTLDGEGRTSSSNIIEGVIPDVALELIGKTEDVVKITILRNPGDAVNRVVEFASAYNDVIRQINYETVKEIAIRNNPEIQKFAQDLASETQKDVSSIENRPKSLKELGLKLALTTSTSLTTTITQALESREAEEDIYSDDLDPTGGVMARLSRLGILGLDDFTLAVDREKLGKSLSENPKRVFDIFNSEPDGVSSRLINKLSDAVGEPYNLIESQKQLIKYYQSNPSAGATILEKKVAAAEENFGVDQTLSSFGSLVA